MSSFEKGHKLNYKVRAKKLWEHGVSTLYNCEGDKVWVANSIHYFYTNDTKEIEIPKEFFKDEGILEIPEWFDKLKFKNK